MLTPGHPAPAVSLTNQHGKHVDLGTLRDRRVLVDFSPKANTPGCTLQACALRDLAAVSPKDLPTRLLEALGR